MLEKKISVQPIDAVIETTGSRPVVVKDTNLDDFACKYDSPQKLLKEYLAHHFLQIWGLPVMTAAFIEVLPEHIDPNNIKQGIITNRTQPHHFRKPCFGTLYNNDSSLMTNTLVGLKSNYTELNKYVNKDDFLKIALFDLWIVNTDRNHGNYNILVQSIGGGYLITPIDHSEIFDGFDIGNKLNQLTPEDSILTSDLASVFLYNKKKIEATIVTLLDNFPTFVKECGKILPKLVEHCPDSWCGNRPKLLQDLNNFVEDDVWMQETLQNFRELVHRQFKL